MKRIAVFTDCDLDGLACFAVFKWFTNFKNVDHQICSQSNFRKTFNSWSRNKNIEDYDKIYIFDLDVSHANIDLVDFKNFTIIDHHDTHVANEDKYKHATTILKDETSCCKLIYTLLKKKYPDKKICDEQKLLVLLADDYDSYELKIKNSYELNVIVWSYVGSRAEQFMNDFGDGFYGFTREHKNIIDINQRTVNRLISELQVYKGTLPIAGKQVRVAATFADKSLNEIAHHVITEHECDVCIIINMRTQRVSFRKNKTTVEDLDLGSLAQKIADGGGHKHAAGGKLTEEMLQLTKMLEL